MGMLILTLRENDVVHLRGDGLDGDLLVKCTRIAGNRVRLGFDAPKDIKVLRDKVTKKIDAQNRS